MWAVQAQMINTKKSAILLLSLLVINSHKRLIETISHYLPINRVYNELSSNLLKWIPTKSNFFLFLIFGQWVKKKKREKIFINQVKCFPTMEICFLFILCDSGEILKWKYFPVILMCGLPFGIPFFVINWKIKNLHRSYIKHIPLLSITPHAHVLYKNKQSETNAQFQLDVTPGPKLLR